MIMMAYSRYIQIFINIKLSEFVPMIHGQKKTDKKKSEEQLKEENDLSDKINSKLS